MSAEARPIDEPPMDASEVRRRASAGAVLITARTTAARIIGFGGQVVLARLLVPEDFGLVALGLAAYAFASLLANAGIGPALIRRSQPPTQAELRSILGFQLSMTIGLAITTVVVTLLLGQEALVVAVVVLSLPLTAFRAPAALLLERDLAYRPLATVEIVQTIAYYTWALCTVALGMGVWGFASASIAQALAGSILMVAASPMRVLMPALKWSHVKPFVGFGWRFQAVNAVQLFQIQMLNVGVAAIAGVATLGLWSLAYRILRVPHLLFHSLWRVSYPGMSRLIAAGESPAPVVERSVCLVAIAAGAMYAPVIGSAPALVPAAFGDNWRQVVDVLPTASVGLMIAAPISVAAVGYLYAIGDATLILRCTMVQTVVWLGLSLPLIVPMGIAALGVGWLISALIGVAILNQAVKRRLGRGLISPVAVPLAVAGAAAGGGWILASGPTPTIVLALEAALLSELLFWAGIAATQRSALTDLIRISRRSIRSAVARPSHG